MRQGQLIEGRYRLDTRIDAGGMGAIWLSCDTSIDRVVAVKILHQELAADDRFRRRFESEARSLGTLRHPGAVSLYDYGEAVVDGETVAYLVMEYVPGRSLQSIVAERGALPAAEILPVLAEVAEALHSAHEVGIVHRDVKLSNILIDRDTGSVKLVDFGIARAHGESGLTSTGTIMGTLSYVSPEHLRGESLTGASDTYSLGVVAYECLAGFRPFTGETPAAIISGHLHRTPPPLPDTLADPVRAAIGQALHKDPAHRQPTARHLAAAFRELAGAQPPAGLRDFAPGPAPAPARASGSAPARDADTVAFTSGLRRWIPVGLAALLAAAAVLVVVIGWDGSKTGATADDTSSSAEPGGTSESSASPSSSDGTSIPDPAKTKDSGAQPGSQTSTGKKKNNEPVCADTPEAGSQFHGAGRACFHPHGDYFKVYDDYPDGFRILATWRNTATGEEDSCATTGSAGTSVECVEQFEEGQKVAFRLQVRNKDVTKWSSESTTVTA